MSSLIDSTSSIPYGDDHGEDGPKANPKLRIDPVAVSINLRPRQTAAAKEHFEATTPKFELTKFKVVSTLAKKRWIQFALIVPNQLIFWLVIFSGLFGTLDPGLNFATAITWYIWFAIVFVLMVVVGRAWCSMCPFGGFGEWIQRKTFFKRTQKTLGLGRKYPQKLAAYGLISSAVSFIVLTFIEEFFNIAGPGTPADTAFMVLGIVLFATASFLIFERRTFCRYLCPLSGLIGSIGAIGAAAGFRTKNRDACYSCESKACMRGGEVGYGCPWYTWPGSAESNSLCGLCTECYKACPSGNVGLYVQPPLTSVIAPSRKRMDIAVVSALLLGLVVFQQVNALNIYTNLDNFLNAHTPFGHYPNVLDYVGLIVLFALVPAALFKVGALAFSNITIKADKDLPFLERHSAFRNFFMVGMYGMVPTIGADYFARQLPKFFSHATRIVPAVIHPFGGSNKFLYNYSMLGTHGIITVQLVIMAIGVAASGYATYKIARREIASNNRDLATLYLVSATLIMGVAIALLYIPMQAAN
ncbi:MAG: 4Fe-4S binding protein [Actinomycetota bacterium]|nr:4Fe-4S binding protein [Actinomycetota bacterium]